MKTNFFKHLTAVITVLAMTAGFSWQNAVAQESDSGLALPQYIDPNSALAEVIHMVQAGVSENVLENYANNVQTRFNLTAEQIIYLKDIGVPDEVVNTMIQRDQQLGEAPPVQTAQTAPTPPPQPAAVDENYFDNSLAPYGSWVAIEGYGRCWRPAVVTYDSSWQPYCEHGHWVYTEDGWYWMSDYSWGWCTFHYGRWFHDARLGWCWWPDTVWGPSWVCWRYSNDYCGWAPLPPHCEYREGIGLVYNGATVSVGFNFGLSAGAFTFVATKDFCDPHPWRHRVASAQMTWIYNQTTVINNFSGNNTTIINRGIPAEHIAAVTHTPLHPVSVREATTPIGRGEQIDRSGTLVVNRPHFNHNTPNAIHNNAPHTISSPATGTPMQASPQNQNNSPTYNRTEPQNRPQNSQNKERRTTPSPARQPERQFSPPANDNQHRAVEPQMTPQPNENRTQPSQGNYNAQPSPHQNNPPPPAAQHHESQLQLSQPSASHDRSDDNRDKDKNNQ